MTQPSEMIKSCLEPYGCFHTFFFFLNAKLNRLFAYSSIYFTVCSRPQVLHGMRCVISPFETLSVCIPLTSPPETRRRMRHNCFSDIFFPFLNLLSLVRYKKKPHTKHIVMGKVILMCFRDNRFHRTLCSPPH